MTYTKSYCVTSGFIVTLLSVLVVAGGAHAQYVGPSVGKSASTVAEILKSTIEDQEVSLRGRLIKKLSHDKYMFSDGTASIRVEIDSKDFPAGSISENTIVDLTGEVEKDFMESPEIDVKRVSVVKI